MNRLQDEIPVEYLLKYERKQKNFYKSKLHYAVGKLKLLQNKYKDLEKTNELYKATIKGLNKEVIKSEPYKELLDKYTKIKHEKDDLLYKLAKTYNEI